jgi:maltose O-acetyltransferase
MIRHLVNLLLWLLPPTRLFALRRRLLRFAGIEMAAGASFCGRGWVYGRGRLVIGRESWISPGCIIHTHPDASVVIEADCDIGPGVEIVTGSHEFGDATRRAGSGTAAPVTIGRGSWLGARVVILGGVTIGSGSVVAAGAVVNGNVEAQTLVAGVPARLKRRLA